jgi:hypothetical protein
MMRSLERILVVAVGGLSIYLGYRLFRHIPSRTDGHGRVILPGGISIFLTRVGPGTFFALFGAIVVAMSFAFPVQYSRFSEESGPSNQTSVTMRTEKMTQETTSGFAPAPAGDRGAEEAAPQARRAALADKMALLNAMTPRLAPEPDPVARQLRDGLLLGVKVDVMRQAWDAEAWGPFEAFERWVKDREPEPPPEKMKTAVVVFRSGREAPP